MGRLYACLTEQHSPTLVLLSVLLCGLTGWTAFRLLDRAGSPGGTGPRSLWLVAAGCALGAGGWSTHFVAMLAYDPGFPVGFDPGSSVAAFLLGVGACLCGLACAQARPTPGGAALGGLLIASGLGGSHILGLEGLVLPGPIAWYLPLAVASPLLGTSLAGAALLVAIRRMGPWPDATAAGLLAAALSALHFLAVAAASVTPDPAVSLGDGQFMREGVALAVVVATLLTSGFVVLSLLQDGRAQAARREADALRALADGTSEGLVVVQDGVIVAVNQSFAALAGYDAEALRGRDPQSLLAPDAEALPAPGPIRPTMRLLAQGSAADRQATRLIREDGRLVPVEVKRSSLVFQGRDSTLLALRDLTERIGAERRIHDLAHRDPLTHLGNRLSLQLSLAQLAGEPNGGSVDFALHCLDLDGFKAVNDLYGHPVGDALLREIAGRLKAAVRPEDGVFRLGGDEFVVIQLLPPQRAARAAGTLARRLVRRLSAPVIIGPHHLTVGASVGVACYPEHGLDADTLLKHADIALYQAKGDGRGRHRVFDRSMLAALQIRHALEDDLKDALHHRRDEFRVVFQPQVSLAADGGIVGYEALLRWRHPTRGEIAPGAFIPIAEVSEAVLALGEFALADACRAAAGWENEAVTVGINVSPAQLKDGRRLVRAVSQALAASGLSPARLVLEITETLLIRDEAKVLKVLRDLKALGVGIVLDDFGTGYSSLTHLKRFPIDGLKVDASFVKDIDTDSTSRAIVGSLVALARSLRLHVTAEGVETRDQLDILRGMGCETVQGYLFGQPAALPRPPAAEASTAGAVEAGHRARAAPVLLH